MRTQYRMRNRVVASVAAAAMAASMAVAVPGAAFATYGTGEIHAKSDEVVSATVGAQVNMADYFSYSASGGDGKWHVDYKVTDGTGATVNKHSGVLTPTAEGDVTVTAYLTGVETQTGTKNNPCEDTDVSATVTVRVAKASSYGYQGNKLGIKMTDPIVSDYTGSNEEGWTNVAKGAIATSGYYNYTIQLNNGFKDLSTAEGFAAVNAKNIELRDASGNTLTFLKKNNNGDVKIVSVDVDSKTIVVSVAATATDACQLVFKDGFRANNPDNTLGTTVTFVIK